MDDPLELPNLADAAPLPLNITPQAPTSLAGYSPQGGQSPQQGGGMGAEIARLLPMLALAGQRGGRAGMAGFIQGLQRARQAKQQQTQQGIQNQRYTDQEQRLQDQATATEKYRQDTLAQQRERDKNALVQEFGKAMLSADLTSPEAVQALTNLYEARAQALGLPAGQLTSIAGQAVTPIRLQQNAINKRWASMSQSQKELAQQTSASLTIDGRVVPYSEWSVVVGGMTDPATGKYPQVAAKPDVPNTAEEQFYQQFAVENGAESFAKLPTAKQAAARKQWMQSDDYPKPTPTDGLTAKQNTQVAAQARTYESLPVVKNTQVMSEAVNFVQSLDPNTKNPADDQALIYAFAKAMDPNSVVREGEYATVQKYAQSWAESFGFNAARIFSNTTFLTPQARMNMKRTIQQRFRAAQGQYKVVRDSYIQKINKITGGTDGAEWLTDYGAAFPTDEPNPTTSGGRATVTPPAAPSAPPARSGGAGPVPNPFRR